MLVQLSLHPVLQSEIDDRIFVVNAETTDVDGMVLVYLHDLCGTTQVDDKLDVAVHRREGIHFARIGMLNIAFEQVELFPRFLIDLQVEFLLAAHLVELQDLLLVHAQFQIM